MYPSVSLYKVRLSEPFIFYPLDNFPTCVKATSFLSKDCSFEICHRVVP